PIDPTAAAGATVAVLRPAQIALEIRSARPGGQVRQVMADQEVRWQVLVKPAAGGKGDPGEVDLSYQVHGPRSGTSYGWSKEPDAPPASEDSTVVPEGRLYPIYPQWLEPGQGQRFYVGYLEVTARRGARIVAALTGGQAHAVEVYPRLSIAPVPALG